MTSPPTRVYADNSVRETIDILIQQHMYNLPVVDRDETFLGEISSRRLTGLLLPDSLTMELGLTNFGFMRESIEELEARFQRVQSHPVSRYMATDIKTVYPDSPIIDALGLLYRKYIRIAVVDRESRRLVGGISFITVLRAIKALDARAARG